MKVQRNSDLRERPDYFHTLGGGNAPMKRLRILVECNRFEANEEIKRQHGPVKILWKDGKPVDQ